MLRHRLVRAWDRAVHLGARIAYLNPAADPRRYGIDLIRDVPYRATLRRGHLLDIYRPGADLPADRPRRNLTPALLYVHGGAFAILSKDTHRIMALAFASQGYTTFLINYRIGPRHLYPAPLEDAAAALTWLIDNAERYGADPNCIILAGESAGANLVTTLAYLATHPRPEPFARRVFEKNPQLAAVLAIYGLLDLNNLGRFNNPKLPWYVKRAIWGAAASYVGIPVEEKASQAPLASPLRLLAESPPPTARPLPPFFIACGTADPLLLDSRKLHAILDSRGVPSELSIHPREIHGFNAMVWRRQARAKWRSAFRFLSRYVEANPSTRSARARAS
jgi:acetyl esterase